MLVAPNGATHLLWLFVNQDGFSRVEYTLVSPAGTVQAFTTIDSGVSSSGPRGTLDSQGRLHVLSSYSAPHATTPNPVTLKEVLLGGELGVGQLLREVGALNRPICGAIQPVVVDLLPLGRRRGSGEIGGAGEGGGVGIVAEG